MCVRILLTAAFCLQATACPNLRANELSRYEQLSGWSMLFDGSTVQGWRNYQSDTVSDGWTVEAGELRARPGAGDLVTVEQYDHFELSLEYKISKQGNSGLLFHVSEDAKQPWHTGPEVQILDHANLPNATEKSGYLYGLYRPERPKWSMRVREAAGIPVTTVDASNPHGEWNQIYIRVSKSQCQVALNGHSYFRFRKGDKTWNQRVAQSKFAKFPQFGRADSGHICLQEHGSAVAFRNLKIRKLTALGEPLKQPVDGKLAIEGEPAFPNLQWQGWEPVDEDGRNRPLRFMELTHAGDQRLFAAAQKGQVFCFENRHDVETSSLFLDITDRVAPWRRHNEEGLLGLAFHPQYEQNGYFYVYYSVQGPERASRISRFTRSPDNPDQADKMSEVVVMKIDQPFNNHNGGSIEFGADGYLYIALGDGGDMNDPFHHGQNRSTLMGSVLRIDVDQISDARQYGIPPDNPFVNLPGARPEIYAFGIRNAWRLAFDSKTQDLWLADVGQDLWEEINLIRPGGNYGWSVREGRNLFGNVALGQVPKPIEPIWQYDHRVGKSITGGRVYRGHRIQELYGKYVYADYVTGRVWALDYDRESGIVRQNLEISDGGITVTAFGEDPEGEVYYMIAAANGQCIYRFKPTDPKPAR